jgi:rhodanese-related sulfurtransferase
VDVRSKAELDLVGRIPGAIHIEWAFYPGMVANPEFATQLQAQVDKNQTIVFMCRTGGRSHNAAIVASELGYKAYNMLEGFDAGLPWTN